METLKNFVAGAFHPSLPEGRTAGTVCVKERTVCFESSDGVREIPFEGMVLSWGGANNALLFLSHSALPEWRFYCRERGFLDELAAVNDSAVRLQVEILRAKHRGARALTISVVAALFVLVSSVFLLRGPITTALANLLPVSAEHRLGALLFRSVSFTSPLIENQETRALLNDFIAPLVPALEKSGFQPKVFLSPARELNAFALPGGYVVLYSSVILEADTPEEVYGVLAHEFAHVAERHVLRGVISSLGLYAFFDLLIGGGAGTLAALGNLAPELLRLGYSRELERAADERGMEFLREAGIDGHGMVRFFKRLEEQQKILGTTQVERVLSFLSTHPTTGERIEYLEQLAGPVRAPREDLQPTFEKLKERLKKTTGAE